MTSWIELQQELDIWSDEGREAHFWWRDDDAVSDTAELQQLLDLKKAYEIPLVLAVIPAFLEKSLAEAIKPIEDLTVGVHGYTHKNYAPLSEKKQELGNHRPSTEVLNQLSKGFAALGESFPDHFGPVLIPPWNRIHADLIPSLSNLGFSWLSTYQPRIIRNAASGVIQLNCHLDPIDWRGTRSAVTERLIASQCLELLTKQRQGLIDNQEPLGILTHHLVHNPAIWKLTEKLVSLLVRHPAVQFVNPFDRR